MHKHFRYIDDDEKKKTQRNNSNQINDRLFYGRGIAASCANGNMNCLPDPINNFVNW